MSFGRLFDGYCVLHAPFATAERRPWFEAELTRIGVDRVTVVAAPEIQPDDPRLAHYRRRPAELSNLEALRAALRFARESGWRNVVVMEDDVVFRRRFTTYWAEVEPEVLSSDWQLLNLHRLPENTDPVIVERPGRTTLIPRLDSICNFCTVFQASAYEAVLDGLDHCFAQQWPSDFYYGHVTRKYGVRLVGTSRNLAGQAPGSSSIQGLRRGTSFYAKFRACRSPVEALVISTMHATWRRVRRSAAH